MTTPASPTFQRFTMSEVITQRPGCFEEYRDILMAVWKLAGGNPIVDLGVGEGHVTKHMDGVYVDLVVRPTSPAKTMNFDLRDAPERLKVHKFNLMVMSDVIEHLRKFDGQQVLDRMDILCKAMFVFTPIGPYHTDPSQTHPDAHKSAWFPKEFTDAGWVVLSYPRYHIFAGNEVLGAFFAWKFRDEVTPSVKTVLELAGVKL